MSLKARQTIMFIVLLLLIPLSSCSVVKNKEIAEQAVTKFHSQYNGEQYNDIYTQADMEFQTAVNESDFTTFMKAINRKLGKVKNKKQVGFYVNVNTAGTYVRLGYNAEFDEGAAAEEFVWRMKDSRAFLVRYDINSPTLVMK